MLRQDTASEGNLIIAFFKGLSMATSQKPLFAWRKAMLNSDLPATTKHVLLTLSCRMNGNGGSCFPSVKTLSKETSLSRQSIMTHLDKSHELGWIDKKKLGLEGQQWARNTYLIAFPPEWGEVQDVDSPDSHEVNLIQEAGQSNKQKAVKEVDTSTSSNTSKNMGRASLEGMRLPDDWVLTPEYIDAALTVRSIDHDELEKLADDFKDYWLSLPGSKAFKLDWLATWRRWIRGQKTTAAITAKQNDWGNR